MSVLSCFLTAERGPKGVTNTVVNWTAVLQLAGRAAFTWTLEAVKPFSVLTVGRSWSAANCSRVWIILLLQSVGLTDCSQQACLFPLAGQPNVCLIWLGFVHISREKGGLRGLHYSFSSNKMGIMKGERGDRRGTGHQKERKLIGGKEQIAEDYRSSTEFWEGNPVLKICICNFN